MSAAECAGIEPAGTEYLCYFCHRLLGFRTAEVDALARWAGCRPEQVRWRPPAGDPDWSPFWHLTLPSDEVAARIAERVMLTRGFFELWGEGTDWAELQRSVEAFPEARKAPWLRPEVSFKVHVDTFGHKLRDAQEQLEHIQRLHFVPFKGPVRMKGAQTVFWLIMCRVSGDNMGMPNTVMPYRLFFGRQVALSQRARFMNDYALRERLYLGPTSMDTEMAFIMCNFGNVRRGSFVFDPYAGTGSILVAAAVLGAHTFGADIDVRVLRDGKPVRQNLVRAAAQQQRPAQHHHHHHHHQQQQQRRRQQQERCSEQSTEQSSATAARAALCTEQARGGAAGPAAADAEAAGAAGVVDIYSNFAQYGAEPPLGLLRLDMHRPCFRQGLEEVFDAVVGDPPYGVRAGGRKSVWRDVEIRDRTTHVPATAPYTLAECLRDLLDCAARLLRLGGRLVYFIPATPEAYHEEEVPTHPALRFVANCEQMMTTRYSRRLVVMEKVHPYDAAAAAAHHEACGEPFMTIDKVHTIVYECLKDERGKKVFPDRPNAKQRFRGKLC